jgi:hypothetical protein
MAGFREFVTGEVLTAANVDDFLMKQSVQKYADAAARDAALGTAVAGGNALREGMVAYLDDTDEVIKYDGTDWSSVAPAIAGIGSNVVQTVKTDTFTTTSGSFVDVTGMSVTITPTIATSKILVLAQVSYGLSFLLGSPRASFRFDGGNSDTYVGDASASKVRGIWTVGAGPSSANYDFMDDMMSGSGIYLDSPATTSATTYKVQMTATNATGYVNRSHNDAYGRGASSLIAIEVAV